MKIHTETTISAAHHLPGYNGLCKNVHGHSFKIEVEIIGLINKEIGMLVDFKEVKDIINKFDHTDLNDYFENPTAENIAHHLANAISLRYPETTVSVKVWESATSWASESVSQSKLNY